MLCLHLDPDVDQAVLILLEAALFFKVICLLKPGLVLRTKKVERTLVPSAFTFWLVEVDAHFLLHGLLVGLDDGGN